MKKFPSDPSIKQGYFTGEDTTCWVMCECEGSDYEIQEVVSDHKIVRCPHCGRGYKVEFVVWQFEPDEVERDEE